MVNEFTMSITCTLYYVYCSSVYVRLTLSNSNYQTTTHSLYAHTVTYPFIDNFPHFWLLFSPE